MQQKIENCDGEKRERDETQNKRRKVNCKANEPFSRSDGEKTMSFLSMNGETTNASDKKLKMLFVDAMSSTMRCAHKEVRAALSIHSIVSVSACCSAIINSSV